METKKLRNPAWSQIIAPVLALSLICCVMSLLLAITNGFTAPIIEQNTLATAQAARQLLLPEADDFEELPLTEEVDNVTAAYRATNGAGFIVETSSPGYGGAVPAMVAFSADGTILGVTFLQNDETPGLGKKLETDPSFAAQFDGLPAETLALDDVDKIASSTISTYAAIVDVNAAIELYNSQLSEMGGAA